MDIADIQAYIASQRALQPPDTYRVIADSLRISPALVWKIERGHEPTDPAIRARLNLHATVEVVPMGGNIRAGAQVLGSIYCNACGEPFVSNHPRRRKCFRCSPYRGIIQTTSE